MFKLIVLIILWLSKAIELEMVTEPTINGNGMNYEKSEDPIRQKYSSLGINMLGYEESIDATNFTGKVVLVTGSNSGIGAETVRLLSYMGANVVVTGRNVTRIKEVGYQCWKLSPYGLRPLEVAADLTVYDQLYNLFDQTISRFNRLDVLVNNAGIAQVSRLIHQNFSRVYRETTAIDETAVIQLTQLFIPYLNQTNGTIINITTEDIDYVVNPTDAYGMAKSAINFISQALTIELGPRIRVNSIRPGYILNTRFIPAGIDIETLDETRAQFVSLGRNGQPLDIARVVVFLASPLAQFIDGHYITVNGGFFPAAPSYSFK